MYMSRPACHLCTTDGDDFAAGSEAVEFAAPAEVAACAITGQPEDESEEIAEGIKPAEAESAAIADDAVSDGDGLEDAGHHVIRQCFQSGFRQSRLG